MLSKHPLERCGARFSVLERASARSVPARAEAHSSKLKRAPHRAIFLALLSLAVAWAQPDQPAPAQPSAMRDPDSKPAPLPAALQGVTLEQRLNQQAPLDLVFRDEYGRSLPLSTYFSGNKPVLLALVYYTCPMLCNLVLNGVESSLKTISLDPGRDFEVVAVSFDPRDTPEIAARKKASYLQRYRRPDTANGWHFLTGDEGSIKALTSAVGFRYRFDPATQQFAHASGIMILTPTGKLSRYFYGVEYAPRDIRLGLVEASQDKIGNPVDQILLFCYHYDPATGKYGAIAMNMVRFGGATFVLICGTFLLIAWRRDWRRDRQVLKQARY
jgi:protein SCO1/2